MKTSAILRLCWLLPSACALDLAGAQGISGVQPESPVLLISEKDGQAQMGVRNGDGEPLLLYTQIHDVEDDAAVRVLPLPPITRVEAGSSQIVRFVLENTGEPLKVQHFKRVTFEGIRPKSGAAAQSQVRVNVRYDYPVVISPKDLKSNDAPWMLLKWKVEGHQLVVRNDSPYVVRMSREVDLLPMLRRVQIASRTVILPNERLAVDLPRDMAGDSLAGVRIYPATAFGYTAPDHDAPLVP